MPKRRIPSDEAAEQDDGKKARTEDGDVDWMNRLTAAAASVRVVARAMRSRPTSASAAEPATARGAGPSGSSASNRPPSISRGDGVGRGNALLSLLRRSVAGVAATASAAATDTAINVNGEAKAATITAPNGPLKDLAQKCNNGATPTALELMVPFPHLPLENESGRTGWTARSCVFLLFLLNVVAVVCIGWQQSRSNLTRMKYNLELNKLEGDLAVSQKEVDSLRDHMAKLEHARGTRERILAEIEHEDPLPPPEDNEGLAKLQRLESEWRIAESEFHRIWSRIAETDP